MPDREPLGVIGAGWVGLVTAACFAELGHDVWVRDVVAEKIDSLSRGDVPIYEPGLSDMIRANSERLHFTLDMDELVGNAELLFCCVDTPPTYSGDADLSRVETVVREIGDLESHALVMKSTVPVGTGRSIKRRLEKMGYTSNPEFLKEGSAIADFMKPDRVAIGAGPEDERFGDRVAALYEPLDAPIVRTDVASAEMIKLASNAFLATKISFINEIANVSEELGADVEEVARGMGLDSRIGPQFLRAGSGYGGSCVAGDESVLVRRQGRIRSWTFEQMWHLVAEAQDAEADAKVLAVEDLEVLSWRARSERPEFMPVSALTRREVDGELIMVATEMGRRVRCTPDHPFVVADAAGEHLFVKTAAELSESDWLPVAQGAPAADRERWFADPVALALGADPPTTDAMARLGEAHHVASASPARAGQDVALAGRRSPWMPAGGDDDERLWRGVGLDIAEGRERSVPDSIWSRPEAHKRALLAGMWQGNGSWSLVAAGPAVVLEFRTASRALADGLLRLLGDLGIVARWRVGRIARSTVDDHWLVVAGAAQIERLLALVPPADAGPIRESLARQGKPIAPTGFRRHAGNAAWVRVTRRSRERYAGPVYSLEVPGAHTVVTTAGLVVHNCFPKDVSALKQLAGNTGYHFQLLTAVIEVNELQKRRTVGKLQKHLGSLVGKEIALLGLAFKPNTDDIREATALVLAARLQSEGAHVRVYDPVAMSNASDLLGGAQLAASAMEALDGADGAVLVTEWPEFGELDWTGEVRRRMANPLVVDGRNFLDRDALIEAGFTYEGVGR